MKFNFIEDISKSKNDQQKKNRARSCCISFDGREDRISDPDDRQSVDWRFQDGFLMIHNCQQNF